MGTVVRRPWETALTLDQNLLDQSQDSLSQRLEFIAEVSTPTGVEHWSDRAKYVGSTFYENRVVFPSIERTVGEFLSGELEFSGLEIQILNADKKFSNLLPGGPDYAGWINRQVEVKIGIAEIASSYITVFDGFVSAVSGFSRDTKTITLSCRNKFESVNVSLPNQVLIEDDFPDIEDELLGVAVPVIYGDWTTDIRGEAPAVPAYPVNGLDPLVNASLDPVDPNVGDTDLRLVISSTPLKTLDTTSVTLFRGDAYYTFDPADISIVGGTNNTVFDIAQENLIIDGTPWNYETGDEFYVKCIGVELGGGTYDNNMVEQCRDILNRFGGISLSDFTSAWDYYRDKAAPAESAIVNIPSRVWFQETARAIELVTGLLEQVRIEPFINRENKWDLTSLHFDEFESAPSFVIRNWDIKRDSFKPSFDSRNNFNKAKADFDFDPSRGQNRRSTAIYKNQAAITQAQGREIAKLITFPNLYKLSDVENQLKEIIKLVSASTELVDVTLTSRSFLKDLGEFAQFSIDIGSIEFSASGQPIVGMFRDLEYDPTTMGIKTRIWLFQMINFPGYTGPTGTVSGYDATIIKEV